MVRLGRGALRHVSLCCAPLRSTIIGSEAEIHANVNFTKRTEEEMKRGDFRMQNDGDLNAKWGAMNLPTSKAIRT